MHKIFILCLLGVFSLSVVLAATTCVRGSGPCCDDDTETLKESGFCASEDDCNNQRNCDGSSAACPANPKGNAGTPCSRATNRCHEDGKCDNMGTCLPQVQKPTGSTCIPADDSKCERVRTCSAAGVCSAKTAAGNTVTCHTATTLCDKTVKCPAASSSTPYACPKQVQNSNTPCRDQNIPDCRERVNCPGNRAGFTYEQNIVCPPEVYSTADTTCGGGSCSTLHCSGTGPGCSLIVPSSIVAAGEDCTADQSCSGDNTAECDGAGACGSCHPPTPGGTNDPLIAGFHHQRFWLEGDSGKSYNMFSQPGMTLNAQIVNARSKSEKIQTVMGEIAFITKNNVVHITPKFGRSGKINVNGKTIELSAKSNLYDLDDCVQMAWSPKSVLFSSADFEIVISFIDAEHAKRENLNVEFLNVKIPHVSGDVTKMSGVIGQTAHEQNDIDKHWIDFEVSDLFAHDSAKNTFTGAALDCENAEASKRNVGKFEAATKKEVEDMNHFAISRA